MGRECLDEFGVADGGVLRMPFGLGVGLGVTSCIRGLGRAGAAGAGLAARKEGTNTVRGRSFPLDAILGVPICRERTREVWASTRWRASSEWC